MLRVSGFVALIHLLLPWTHALDMFSQINSRDHMFCPFNIFYYQFNPITLTHLTILLPRQVCFHSFLHFFSL